MKTHAGWTLIELMVVVTVLTVVGGTLLTVFDVVRTEDRLAAACASDMSALRRAATTLEDDLRNAGAQGAEAWSLRDRDLLREDRVLARHIESFDLTWRDGLAHVTLQLAPRSDAPHRRQAVLAFVVRPRATGAP